MPTLGTKLIATVTMVAISITIYTMKTVRIT